MTISIIKQACPHDCPDACALEVSVENGKAIAVHGARGHATTHGVLCTKVTHGLERTYHPDRVLQPLKRIGKKGDGQFAPISWNEALATIASEWKKTIATDGAESILPYSYAGNMGILNYQTLGHRLFYAMGASQLDRTICSSAGFAGMEATLGGAVGTRMEQMANAELILIWGANPITSSVHSWSYITQARKNGARVIAIDPYKSLTAQKCDEHIALKQGTDAALALGLMHCLARDGTLDDDYLANYTLGWPEFALRLAAWTPARTSEITGIPAAQIEALAAAYGATQKSIIRANYGLNRHAGGGMAVRTIACLPALTGAWREAAGGFLLSSSGHYPIAKNALARPDLMPLKNGKPPRMINMSQLGDALTKVNDPPVNALYVYNSNPAVIAPDSNAVIRGLAREDLFTVVHDTFLTDTARYADIVLPATTHFENFDIHRSYGHTSVLISHPAIAPLGESKSNGDTFRALAVAMGLTDPALHESDNALARQAFDWSHPAMQGISYDQIARDGWAQMQIADAPFAHGNFPSPSGKVEFYNERLVALGLDPYPTYVAPAELGNDAKFPLALNSPPYRHFMNSTFANVARYRKDMPEPLLEIHPDDARTRKITCGADLRVFNDRGSVRLKAKITENASRGCVTAQSVWWTKDMTDGQGINVLTSQKLTDMGGGATFYDCAVEVEMIAI